MRFGEVSRNPVKDYRVIHGSFRVKTIYDYMGAQQNGAIASLMTTYDIVKKKIDFPEYRMSTTGILNENSLFRPDVVAAASPVRMSMMKHFSSNSHQQNSTNSGFGQQRIAEMHMLESSKIEIDVYGRTDYTVGKKVFLGVNAINTIASATYTMAGSYSSNASSALSLISDIVNSTSYSTFTSTATGVSSIMHGGRVLKLPLSTLLTPGQYWLGLWNASSGAGTAGNMLRISLAAASMANYFLPGTATGTSNPGIADSLGMGSTSATNVMASVSLPTLVQNAGGSPIVAVPIAILTN
jgi:hypothetical protein